MPKAPRLAVPDFVLPEWNLEAILYIVPVAIAPAIEHFGHILAIGNVTGRHYVKDPGIHRTMLGDGIATTFASLLGGPPNTTYSEVTGAVTLTKVYNLSIVALILVFGIGGMTLFGGQIRPGRHRPGRRAGRDPEPDSAPYPFLIGAKNRPGAIHGAGRRDSGLI